MKKTLLILLALLMLAPPAAAQMPDIPPGIEKKCDAILAGLTPALAAIEYNYYAVYHRHWQGLRTHVTLPANGHGEAPDKSRRPSDQTEDWNAVAVPLPATMELAVSVNVYDGPAGSGYVVVGEIKIGGQVWRRQINYGPENWRDSGGWFNASN